MPEPVLAAEDVTRRYGKWRPPDEDKAALHHRAEHAHHDFFDVWSSRVRDFKEFGVGHMMYFYFLYWMAALFGVLALLTAVPNIALNYMGKFYEAGNVELMSLGNFGRVSVAHNYNGAAELTRNITDEGWEREAFITAAFMSDASLPPATQPFNKAAAITAMSVLDCVGILLYFCMSLGLIRLAHRLSHDADMHTVTIHDYSIRVERLPKDAAAEELVEFFGQYGEVVHVEMVRAYGRLVQLVLRRGKLLRQLQAATAALQKEAQTWEEVPASQEAACYKIKDQIDELNKHVQVEQAQADSHRVVGAFVTFKDEAGKLSCLKAQPHSRMRQWFALKPEHKLRGRHALMITDAPEPSDVKYENMENGSFKRFCRAALVAACSYSGLAAGFVLISLASAMRLNLSRVAGVTTEQCNANCRLTVNGDLGLSQSDRDLYKSCGQSGKQADGVTDCSDADKVCYKCYCFKAVTAGMLEESLYCSGTANLLLLEWSSQFMIVIVILIINSLLSVTSRWLTRFEKHHTRSAEARSLAHKLFLAQFLNSALSTIIANAHLPFMSQLLQGTVLAGLFFQGIYTDLTPNWYKVVGRSLVISQFVGALLRVSNVLIKWLTMRYRYWKRGQSLTQEQLQKSMRGPKFELDQRYGEHLNVIYVSLLLSGGQPISYVAAAFWFLTAYWCDKVELLTLSRRPITYGSDLSNMVISMLPFAAVFHVGFAIWAFSLFGVPRSPLITQGFAALVLNICNATARAWAAASGITPDQAAQRLLAGDSAHLLVACIIMVVVLFVKVTFTTWLKVGRWLLSMVGVIEDQEEGEVSGAPEFPVAVRTQLLVGETSYAIQAQPSYAAAFTTLEDAAGDVLVQVVLKKGLDKLVGSSNPQKAKQLSPRSPSGLAAGPTSPPSNKKAQAAAALTALADYHQGGWEQHNLGGAQRGVAGGEAVAATTAVSGTGTLALSAAAAVGRASQQQQQEMLPGGACEGPTGGYQQQQHWQQENERGGRSETPERMALPQKYRQARANQVLPIPAEYVSAARAGSFVPSTADDQN